MILITRGIAFDRITRRKALFAITLVAVIMLFLGATLLAPWLDKRLLFFCLYWMACGWLTICILLLAIYDILRVLAEARREKKALFESLGKNKSNSKN